MIWSFQGWFDEVNGWNRKINSFSQVYNKTEKNVIQSIDLLQSNALYSNDFFPN